MHNVNDPTWADIFALWEHDANLAADIGEKVRTVQKWRERDSVPAGKLLGIYWSAQIRGVPVTAERILYMASERPRLIAIATPGQAAAAPD